MTTDYRQSLFVTCVGLCGLALACVGNPDVQGKDPPAATSSLAKVADGVDEFYARVDKVRSATELEVTILDLWDPMDKIRGWRWPQGKAHVQPAKRILILEELVPPAATADQQAAIEFLRKTLKESSNELVCTCSSVTKRKEAGGEVLCATGCTFLKNGETLNRVLITAGQATTTNPIDKYLEHEAKQNHRGMWRNAK